MSCCSSSSKRLNEVNLGLLLDEASDKEQTNGAQLFNTTFALALSKNTSVLGVKRFTEKLNYQ